MKYIVTAERFRPLVKNAKGKMVPGPRFFKGDTVEMSEEDAARLVRTGGLALADGQEEVEETPTDETVSTPDEDGVSENSDEEGGEAASVVPPSFADMSYADLQVLAKDVTGNGGGSKDDLIERLTAHYAENN